MKALLLLTVSSQKQLRGVSMDAQEKACRDWAAANNIEVIEPPLKVPGFSRREADIITLLETYEKKGITAYKDLREHWQLKDFDVLIIYTYSRASRSSTGFSWVIENTVLCGASVYFIDAGWVNRTNMREYIAIGSIMAAGEVDRMVARRKPAMAARIARGLPYNKPPLSHKVVYDPETGKAIEMIVDPAKRGLLDDIVRLLVDDRVSWDSIEMEAYKRYGHVDPRTGKRYPANTFYQLVYSPVTHGHAAIHWAEHRFGTWVYDLSADVPEGVTVHRNTHPAAWTGQLALRLFAELHRRETLRGRARPDSTLPFSGIIVCGECGKTVSGIGNDPKRPVRRYGYRCQTRMKHRYRGYTAECSQYRSVNQKAVKEKVDIILKKWLTGERVEELEQPESIGIADRAAQLAQEIAGLEKQLDARVNAPISLTNPVALRSFEAMLNNLGEEIETKRALLKKITAEQVSNNEVELQRADALEELRKLGLVQLWEQPWPYINQLLRRIFAKHKLVLLDAQIVAVRLQK